MVDVTPTSTLHTHCPCALTLLPLPVVSVHTSVPSPRLLDAQHTSRDRPAATQAGCPEWWMSLGSQATHVAFCPFSISLSFKNMMFFNGNRITFTSSY